MLLLMLMLMLLLMLMLMLLLLMMMTMMLVLLLLLSVHCQRLLNSLESTNFKANPRIQPLHPKPNPTHQSRRHKTSTRTCSMAPHSSASTSSCAMRDISKRTPAAKMLSKLE
jgi:hypothetical protein